MWLQEVLSVRGQFFADGSVELTDDDPEIGSVGTIKMRPEVAARFVALHAEHAKK